ncbi:MAG TPA: hypothetical protein VIY73_17990 [Polyangiaceae bacterium]
MAGKKTRTAFAVAAGVWFAALGSAAALTYDLNRPLHAVVVSSEPSNPPVPALDATSTFVVEPVPGTLYVPTVTIVARRQRAPAAAVRRTTAPIDISAMHCEDWRDLDMGSGRVQVCQ